MAKPSGGTGSLGRVEWEAIYAERRLTLRYAVLLLATAPEAWIQRRVEDIDVTSRRVVRRRLGVDLVLPADRADLRLGDDEHAPLVVPLGMLRKHQLIDFELAEGASSRMLVSARLNTIVAAGALWNAATLLDGVPPDVATRALPVFERIVAPDVGRAAKALAVGLPGRRLGGHDAPRTAALAGQLAESYLLLVELPETGARHRVVTFATDQILDEARTPPWAERIGLRPSEVTFDIPGASQAPSYHAEVRVPDGCVPAALLAGALVADGATEPEPTATALLLSGLGAVTGLVIRPGEPPLTRDLHQVARWLLVVVLVLSLVGAGAIALGARDGTLAAIWAVCGVLAAAVAGTLGLSVRGIAQATRRTARS